MPWWVQVIIAVISHVVQRSAQKKAAQKAKTQQEEQQRQADLLAAQSRGILLNAEANDSPLPVIYGRRRVGGITCLKETAGASNDQLHKVVALGEGPIYEVVAHYLDNVLSTDARFSNLVTFENQLGADSQTASAALIAELPGKWTAAHRGRGVAYVYGKFTWSDAAWQGEPSITCDVLGRLLYDPRDAATRFSNNPALALRDYLTNERYGRGIASSAIDDDSFIAAANFCDERVSCPAHSESVTVVAALNTLNFGVPTIFGLGDGVRFPGSAPGGLSAATTYYYIPLAEQFGRVASSYANAVAGNALTITSGDGGTFTLDLVDQARHQLDGVVDVANTPLDNVGVLLSACRGYLVYCAGQYKLKCDQAEAASGFVFNEDNIVGVWKIQLASRRDRFNRVTANFFNPARQWQPDFAVFDSPTYRTADNELVLETEISLPYTANIFRALRHAQLECRQSRLGTQVRFRATVAALKCEVGDVVQITHSTPGWTLQKFRIDALELRPDDEVDVFASEYDDGAYDLDPLTAVRTAPITNLPNPFDISAPVNVLAFSGNEELFVAADGTVVSRMRVRWDDPMDVFVTDGGNVEIQIKPAAAAEWQDAPPVDGSALEVLLYPVEDGVLYDVRVRFRNRAFIPSGWTAIQHTVVGKTEPPSDVELFTIEGTRLTWTPVADLDVIGYRLRYQPGTLRSWGDGIALHQGLVTDSPFDMLVVPVGAVTIMVKAVDFSGNESDMPAYIVTDLGDPIVANVVETFDLKAAGFTGTKTNCSVSGGDLVADALAGPLMWAANEEANWWSDDSAALMWSGASTMYAAMTYVDSITISEALAGSTLTIDYAITGDPWAIEYRESSPKPFWSLSADDTMWSADSGTLWWDQPAWLPWPGQITVGNSVYDIRISAGQSLTQGQVTTLTLTVDAPDIDEVVNDVVISALGTRLTLTGGFAAISNVQLTVQNDGGTAITARTEDKSVALGPLIMCLDAAGSATTGLVDARVQGY